LAIAIDLPVSEGTSIASGLQDWTAQSSDPAIFKWMVGSPPPENRTIRFEDGSYFQ